MKATITAVLCAALIALPVQESKGFGVQCGIAVLLVVVVGTSVYVIHKCNENSEDHCYNCDTEVPSDQTVCAYCGYPFRCEVCDTEIGKDDENCKKCGTKIPDPVKPKKRLEVSTNGTDWSEAIPDSGQNLAALKIVSFKSDGEFDQWLASQSNVTQVTKIGSHSHAFFRLAE